MERTKTMRIQVVGVGIVGLATADGFRRFGYDVTLTDIDDAKIQQLKRDGWNAHARPQNADVHFICVPERFVENVVRDLNVNQPEQTGLIVVRSSVDPGTCVRLMNVYPGKHLCSNPEFLKEATALSDFLNPDKIVIGECCEEHGDLLESLYEPFRASIVKTDPTTAEMVKMTTNAYLATQISFWNTIHKICEKTSVNSHVVGKICALDHRISSYGAGQHGKPFGLHCLPKDLSNLIRYSETVGYDPLLLKAVKKVNDDCIS